MSKRGSGQRVPACVRISSRRRPLACASCPHCSLHTGASRSRPPSPSPKSSRDTGKPQAVGERAYRARHPGGLRAAGGHVHRRCAQPYKFAAVRSSPNCQARARFVDFVKATAFGGGWLEVQRRDPRTQCGLSSLQAVVRVWRKPADVAPPNWMRRAVSRIYLQEAGEQAKTQKPAKGADVRRGDEAGRQALSG